MKPKMLFITVMMQFAFVSVFSQFVLKEGYLSLYPKDKAEQQFKFKNLILYPVIGGISFQHESYKGKYTTLEDALKQKKVRITEKENSGGEVNELYIENLSKDTVYLMAGEVVKGGKQDRVISDDRILEPNSGKINLQVFCVEQGRWTYRSDHNFSQYHSLSANSVRKSAAVSKNQGEVWQKVAEVNDKQKTRTSTGTYTAISTSTGLSKEINEYTAFFQEIFSKIPNCVGFVGISGDKIIGCDIFANSDMFRQQLKSLLQSYCTEAITNGEPAATDFNKVSIYLKSYLANEKNQDQKIEQIGKKYEFKGKKMHINTY